MPLPLLGVAVSSSVVLAAELLLIAAAAYAGGSSVAFLTLGHRRMQVLLSFTGGIMLGVALLHLLPHASAAFGGRIEDVVPWVLGGFFLMFLLERAFHGHAHHAVDPTACSADCHPEHGENDHDHAASDGRLAEAGHGGEAGRWGWCGAFAGLAVHSLADGAALAAAVGVNGSANGGGGGWLAGCATFLAILLHKPFDAGVIATLMIRAGSTSAQRRLVNLAYALLVPAGAVVFLVSLRGVGDGRSLVLGAVLAMAAGAFLCIAAADLLPEVEFHSHDRVLLSASLALGILVAWGITVLEGAKAADARAVRVHAAADHDPAAAR